MIDGNGVVKGGIAGRITYAAEGRIEVLGFLIRVLMRSRRA